MSKPVTPIRRNLAAVVDISPVVYDAETWEANVNLSIPSLNLTFQVPTLVTRSFLASASSAEAGFLEAGSQALHIALESALVGKRAAKAGTKPTGDDPRIADLERQLEALAQKYDRLLMTRMGILHDRMP